MTRYVLMVFGLVVIAQRGQAEPPPDPSALEFFEREVRPLLVGRCQECHGAKKQKGDLRLDSRAAVLAGGSTGPAVVPGKAGESLLVDAINYGDLYQMPPKSKLPASEIAVLTRWIDMGAPWPGDDRPKSAAKVAAAFDLEARAKHWSFRPIRAPEPPEVRDRAWPKDAIDRFILAALEAKGLAPAPEADRRTLIRRATFDLIGLPPEPAEIDAFLEDESPDAFEKVVDRLLASPHYGERWGRHWLDLVRYAETAGHEFDYDLPDASGYRDYVIRALNADLPYDQFVVEQVAGDLLDPPRRHPTEGFNESILGTGFFFLGEGTHSPVDLREEEAQRLDNQIDVFSKTFLGLTVACARCHDHKFDAISTKDYYALAGYLQSSRSVQAFIDPPDRIAPLVAELKALKATMEDLVAVPSARGPGDSSRDAPRRRRVGALRGFRRARFPGLVRHGRRLRHRAEPGGGLAADAGRGESRRACRCRRGWRTAAWSPIGSRACSGRARSPSRSRTSITWRRGRGPGSTSWSTASRRSAARSMAA